MQVANRFMSAMRQELGSEHLEMYGPGDFAMGAVNVPYDMSALPPTSARIAIAVSILCY